MKKSKHFIQYLEDSFSISVKIINNGKIRERSIINYNGNNSKKYRNDNKKRIKEYRKKYYIENKKKIINEVNKYRKTNKGKEVKKITRYRRKGYGYIPLNKPFKNCHFHHIHINGDHNLGIHIPAELHNSIWHSYKDQESMNKINKLAFEWWINEIN